MFVKLLTAFLVLAALVWMLRPLRRRLGRGRADPAPRLPRAHDLEKCPGCGVWVPSGHRCDCDARV